MCFQDDLKELYSYRDLFFENHPLDMAGAKNKCVDEKKEILVKKFEAIDGLSLTFIKSRNI